MLYLLHVNNFFVQTLKEVDRRGHFCVVLGLFLLARKNMTPKHHFFGCIRREESHQYYERTGNIRSQMPAILRRTLTILLETVGSNFSDGQAGRPILCGWLRKAVRHHQSSQGQNTSWSTQSLNKWTNAAVLHLFCYKMYRSALSTHVQNPDLKVRAMTFERQDTRVRNILNTIYKNDN